MAAGSGLVLFEAIEVMWIGFQPLQVLFTLVGLGVIILGWGGRT